MAYKSITFSDIDGTLVHYLDEPGQLQEVQQNQQLQPPNSGVSHASTVHC